MKDLYRRNNLRALESDFVKIHNCHSDDASDNEAAFSILLNRERKKQYDKTYLLLKKLSYLRKQYNIVDSNNWDRKYSDFLDSSEQFATRERSKTSNIVQNKVPTKKIGIFTMVCFVVVLLGFNFLSNKDGLPGSESQEIERPEETINKYALYNRVPLHEKPNESSAILDELKLFQDIEALKAESDSGWDTVEYFDNYAYVQSRHLGIGMGYQAYLQSCQSPPMEKPSHGQALFNTRTGPHSLVIINPPGQDAVVKLKDESNHDVIVYYVDGGKSLTLDNIPEGLYSLWYAIGDNYNYGCGHFLENVHAWREKDRVNFNLRVERLLEYPTSHVLSLKNQFSNASPVDLRDF